MRSSWSKNREGCFIQGKKVASALYIALVLAIIASLSTLPPELSAGSDENRPNNITWTKEDSPISIVGSSFEVSAGQTLAIEPGVEVRFGKGLGIDVRGRILALGTATDPILFTGLPLQDERWRSVALVEDEGSIFNHVEIDMSEGGLQIVASSPVVENSAIYSGSSAAVAVTSRGGSRSDPFFSNCTLQSGFSFDLEISGQSWVTLLDSYYDDTKTRLGDQGSVLERQWHVDVRVGNSLGEYLQGNVVRVQDNANGTAVHDQLSDEYGVARFVVTEYVDRFAFSGSDRIYYTPHTISSSRAGYEDNTETHWIDDAREIVLILHDHTAPVTTLLISGPEHGTVPTYVAAETEFSFDVSDGGTAPVQTQFKIDGGNWIIYEGEPFVLTNEGFHNISFFSSDPAFNIETPKRRLLFTDNTPPTVSFRLDSDGEGTNPVSVPTQTTMIIEAYDGGSGLSNLRYSIDGGTQREFSEPLTFSSEGHYNITYSAQDWIGNLAEENVWLKVKSPVLPPTNFPPYFVSTPIEQVNAGDLYHYQAEAIDPDGDNLVYSLLDFPEGMDIDHDTGLVTWTPAENQEGTHYIRVVVSDGEDSDLQVFSVEVRSRDAASSDLIVVYGALGAFALVGVSLIGYTEYGRFRFFLFFLVPLYSKLRREEVLNQFLRGQIYGYILAYPGENYSSIKRALNISNGTLTHHLYILDREGFVTSRVDGRCKRFYPTGLGLDKKRRRTRVSMIQRAVLKLMRQNPGISQTEIAEALETSKQVVNYHVKALEKHGVVRVVKNGNNLEYRVQEKEIGSRRQ